MFNVDIHGETVKVYLNERLVIVHSPEEPFVWAGKGKWTLRDANVTDNVNEQAFLTRANYDPNRCVLRLSGGDFSLSFHLSEQDGALVLIPQRSTTGLNRLKLNFPAKPGQEIYGGGAQCRSINLKGQRVPLWVREQRVLEHNHAWPAVRFKGNHSHPTYFPIPSFFTGDCIWHHFDCQTLMVFDFTSPKVNRVEFCDLPASITIGTACTPFEATAALSKVNGRQPLLPQWAIEGSCLEVQGGGKAMVEILDKVVSAGAPITSLWIKDWSGSHQTPVGPKPFFDWIWNRELYPKLDSIIRELTSMNVRTMAYVNPHLSIEGRLYAEASMQGYLIKKPQGGNYINDMGGVMAGHIDLTNPRACHWYKEIVKSNILNLGFSGYFADMGDYLPGDAILHSGENPLKIHNRWPVQWAKLNREAVREAGRTSDCVFYTRSGWKGSGSQTMLASTGDHHTSWGKENGLPSALTAALSLSCSGMGLSQIDCGGNRTYFIRRSKELLWRWMDFCAFTPILRMVVGQKEDWQVNSDADTLAHFARMSKVHAHLMPYVRVCVKENAVEGYPVMRPLFMCFPDDTALKSLHDSYMLGSELLVSPVLARRERKHKVTLPEGRWVHLWSGKEYGKGSHYVSAAFGKTPVFYQFGGKHSELFEELPRKL